MTAKSFTLPAFAKINFDLRILGKRDDGFHELCTIFQTVSLADKLTFTENDELILTCDNKNIPIDESNIIIKAANELLNKFEIKKGAIINLEKNIPSPGGLGGGSSDCAIALLGLAKLWNLKIEFAELIEIGKKLGSDVPFFFYGGTAFGTGRGTEIEQIQDVSEKYLLLVTPQIEISTKLAFERLNKPYLTNFESKSILEICRNDAKRFDLRHSVLKNDFEESVFSLYPEVQRVKEKLLRLGAVRSLLSGSGASVFAVFDKEETRQTTMKAIRTEENWRMFAVAAISRQKYRVALKLC
jgi:4-diphosphocytidyl-2-C-methyl-D-erythritol kinase